MLDSPLFRKFNSPLIQVIFLGFVCLCCPGMFNALSGLGAGGSMSSNVGLTDTANGVLYGCFAIVGFFAGTFTNTVGVKYTLTVSTLPQIISIELCFSFSSCTKYEASNRLAPLATLYILLPCGCMIVSKFPVLSLRQVLFLDVALVSFGQHSK